MSQPENSQNSHWVSDETMAGWVKRALIDARSHGLPGLPKESVRAACEQLQEIAVAKALYDLIVSGRVECRYSESDELQIRLLPDN